MPHSPLMYNPRHVLKFSLKEWSTDIASALAIFCGSGSFSLSLMLLPPHSSHLHKGAAYYSALRC
uniref:Uncharacterized protein n=1 Tax=Rhizophora mucronata TaxID=61149 RepID=A0A2P2NYW9_RHIMU